MTNGQPQRIQRKRAKGWRMPPNTVYVGRGSRFGNPHDWRDGVEVGGEGWAKGAAVDLFREWFYYPARFPDKPAPPTSADLRAALAGKNLACWCAPDQPCHADVLLGIANCACGEQPPSTKEG